MSTVVGVDIGGANLKYAASTGEAVSVGFPMWLRSADLADQLAVDLARFARVDSLAVTMTGELADCFENRADGVHTIIDQVERAAQRCGIADVRYYAIDRGFLSASEAKCDVDHVAASNWHALASFVAAKIAPDAMLIDVGSTTTDLIAVAEGRVVTRSVTDFDRLVEGSLVYVGCERTPVCALVHSFLFRGTRVPVMNEWFATIDDARLVLGTARESLDADTTADRRPRLKRCATARLARMIGLDGDALTATEARGLATQVVEAACDQIAHSLEQLAWRGARYVISGHGHDLLPSLPAERTTDLREHLGKEFSRGAPAHAVAQLSLQRSPSLGEPCGGW